jgi:hypothetical protein
MQYENFQIVSVQNCAGLAEVRNDCAKFVVKVPVFNNVHIVKIH